MSEVDALEKKYKKAGKYIVSAGMLPFPITDTLVEILKFYLDEEDCDFISKTFRSKKSLSEEKMIKKSRLPKEDAIRIAEKLAKKGFIFNQPSSKGIMVYRLLPLVVIGTFEYTFMQDNPVGFSDSELKELALLYDKLIEELRDNVQAGYENILPIFQRQRPTDRTIAIAETESGAEITIEINESIEAEEKVLPAQDVAEIIKKFDDIAVGNCFCRNYHKTLGEPCQIDAPMEVCFTFGKSARHTVQQGFARKIDKDEALEILKQSEEAGLVHKAFHNGSDINRDENSICNCCKCCCDTFNFWKMGATPMVNSTNFLSKIDGAACIGCGTCVERCPTDAISLNEENKAERVEDYCIGCGICAHFCPENAISLIEGMRKVFVPPPRIR